jgi:hypothetical protein
MENKISRKETKLCCIVSPLGVALTGVVLSGRVIFALIARFAPSGNFAPTMAGFPTGQGLFSVCLLFTDIPPLVTSLLNQAFHLTGH